MRCRHHFGHKWRYEADHPWPAAGTCAKPRPLLNPIATPPPTEAEGARPVQRVAARVADGEASPPHLRSSSGQRCSELARQRVHLRRLQAPGRRDDLRRCRSRVAIRALCALASITKTPAGPIAMWSILALVRGIRRSCSTSTPASPSRNVPSAASPRAPCSQATVDCGASVTCRRSFPMRGCAAITRSSRRLRRRAPSRPADPPAVPRSNSSLIRSALRRQSVCRARRESRPTSGRLPNAPTARCSARRVSLR